MFSGCN